jgi:hypothetical protein
MAKRAVAAQRRGLLYGLIVAIFIAVIFIGMTFYYANELKNTLAFIDPKAQDEPAQVKAALNKANTALLNAGYVVGKRPLTETIDEMAKQSSNYETAIKALGYSITEQSPPTDLHGESLLTWVKDQNNKADLALADSVDALKIVPKEPDVKDVKVEKPGNLVLALSLEKSHLAALATAYDQKIADLAGAKTNADSLTKVIETNKKTDEDKFNAMFEEKQKAIAELQATQRRVQEQSDQLAKEKEDVRAQLIKTQNDDKAKAQKLTNKINELEAQLAEMAQRMQRATARVFEPDGKVVRIAAGSRIGYINLNRNDGVFNNLTFSVFDPLEVVKDNPQPKGFIKITNVMDDSSEVYITSSRKSDPIIEGDVITNVVYDHSRRFHFAVVGRFDLNNTGHDDTELVKQYIQRYGGKIDDKITVHTDFLVVGADPMSAAPGAIVTPQADVHTKQLQQAQVDMGDATEFARRYWIPVLNQNRFLALIGVKPADMK